MLGDAVPLSEVAFVVVDLETTGGSPVNDAITEIGAVRFHGMERVGSFQSLVDPAATDPAVHRAPDRHRRSPGRRGAGAGADPAQLPGVRPRRGDRGAQRDVRRGLPERQPAAPGLRHRCRRPAICTAKLARRLVWPDVPNVKLHTLATLLPHAHEADPPRARRRRGDGRSVPGPARRGAASRDPDAGRARPRVQRARTAPLREDRAGPRPSPIAGRVRLPRPRRERSSTSARRRTCARA